MTSSEKHPFCPKPPTIFVREATGLTRTLSGWDALIGNLMIMVIAFLFVYGFFASLLFPGVNLPATVLVAMVPAFVMSIIYYLFTVAMPRTGGDYVWVSRIVHPSMGFLANFFITFTLASFLGPAGIWAAIYGLNPLFAALGIINSNPSLISLATSVGSPPWNFLIGVAFVSIFMIPLFLGVKATFRTLWVLFAVVIVGVLVLVFSFFSAPNPTFVSNFNALSGMNYAQTISKAGLPMGFTLQMTLYGSVFTVLNFAGFSFSSYYTGEVKRVRSSQLLGIIGATIVFAVIALLVYGSVYYSAGSDFLNAASSLSGSGSSSYTLPSPPILNFLVAFASPNPIVVILVGLGFLAGCAGSVVLNVFITVRNMFAWSFDRIMPSALTKLDSRRGSAYVGIAVTWVIGVLSAYLYVYTIFETYILYSALMTFVTFAIVSVAAIVFPYRRKDIFDSSDSVVRKKIAGVPLISILGAVGLIASLILGYADILPVETAPPSGPPLVQAVAYAFVPLCAVACMVIYLAAYYYRKSQGLDLALTFKQIPPE